MKKTSRMMILALSLAWAFGVSGLGLAAEFPDRPIRVIVPYAAGGGNDVLARAFQIPFEGTLGTKLVVENIPAGTTKMATLEVLKAKPDGYTIVIMSDPGWVGYYYSGTYDDKVWEKLTPVANLTSEPYGFVEVRAESTYKTWADLVRAAKEKPGQLTCGGPGAGGMMELIMNTITQSSGVETRYVPFAGAGPSRIALLGGHTDFRVCQPTEAIAMIRAGKTRGLAVSTDQRMEALPDVPTFKELKIGPTITLTRSIWGPPKLPQKIVNTLTQAAEKAAKDRKFIKIIQEDLLYTVEYRPPKKLYDALVGFDKTWGEQMRASFKK
jgi:tripartite-type tricarboxylate transporter receptor subunit TctC